MSAHSTNAWFLGAIHRRPGLADLLKDMLALYRQRKSLSELDDHMLEDIGITREQARRESSRPAWDVPTHWTR